MQNLIIFNTSFYIVKSFVPTWKHWLKTKVLQGINAQAGHLKIEIFEMMITIDEEYQTFSVQWRCSTMREAEQLGGLLSEYYDRMSDVFGDSVTCFNSMMEKYDLT
ncbi:MAG: DUF4286 family protein [Cytophagaceae bacterium]|nr:DUF4286 family protein [Cytophagaceae bacterium]